jgi:hypothetical protein
VFGKNNGEESDSDNVGDVLSVLHNLEEKYCRVKCTSGPQSCVSVSSRSTNSKSVSSQSLNAVRITLWSKRVSLRSVVLTWNACVDRDMDNKSRVESV